jgi:hypothetical protein
MYDFAFYFFYGMLVRRKDNTVFTSVLGVAIIISLHILSIAILLSYFDVIAEIPVFSKTYLYNKLYWYAPVLLLIGIVFMYFTKSKVKSILEKYSARENFYSFGNIILFLLMIVVPSLVIAKFK